MKYFLLALLLIGCAKPEYTPGPNDQPAPHPLIIAEGTSGPVDWACQVEDLNDKLVWVECNFKNAVHFPVGSVCVNVNFYDEEAKKLVVGSRNVCSGPLLTLGTSTNYAAFTKEKRQALQQCGDNLQSCVMLAERNLEVIQ